MTISENGLNVIKKFEKLALKAYRDPGSTDGLPITLGYGSTKWEDGSKIHLGETITMERADKLLRLEVVPYASTVSALVKVPLSQNQFDALCSFTYNVGRGQEGFAGSTLLKKINASAPLEEIRQQFMRWVKNDGKVIQGLIKRRQQEFILYSTQ